MKKLGRRGRLWLRSFHLLFVGAFIGGIFGEMIILLFSGNATDDSALNATYAVHQLPDLVGGIGLIGTIITALLLCWLTHWGFFKYKWVIYSEVAVILGCLNAIIWKSPAIGKLAALAEVEGLSALQNPEYVSAWNTSIIFTIVCLVIIISVVFVSVLKPWREHESVEAAT